MQTNLAYDYVDGIPWESYPSFAFSNDTEKYLSALKHAVDIVPYTKDRIYFSDDVWDFNPYFDGINSASIKIVYDGLPEMVKVYCKFYVLHAIMGKKKISTANSRFSSFKSVFLHITETTNHDTLSIITTADIISEVNKRNLAPASQHDLYTGVLQVYEFFIINYKLDLPVSIKELKEISLLSRKMAMNPEYRLPDIPEEYYNKILTTAIEVMRSVSVERYNDIVTACIIVMLSQLGLRLGDMLALRVSQLYSKRLPQSGVVADYIRYKSRKPSKPHDNLLEFDIFCNQLGREAFNKLIDLRSKNPLSEGNDFLCIYSLKHWNGKLPVPNYQFGNEFKRFLLRYLPESSQKKWPGIPWSSLLINQNKKVYLSVPDTRQFRVHLCTVLYNHNIPLTYIQKYMGHLSEYMLGYYVRPKDTYQENIACSERIIKEIVKDDYLPLGGAFGKEIKDKIQLFVSSNDVNVVDDIDAIIQKLGDKVIIRAKTGGVCIKTSLMPCAKDARTNEIFCAYDICPNLFSFFYMIDVSYVDFRTLQDSYTSLISLGKTKAAQKELNKIKAMCSRRLQPQLDELEKELERKGQEYITVRYPSLSLIISNKAAIREEISEWMMKS